VGAASFPIKQSDWPLLGVFKRSKQGLDHKHVAASRADASNGLKMREMFIQGGWKERSGIEPNKHATNPDMEESTNPRR
jgi:hypothetical protein